MKSFRSYILLACLLMPLQASAQFSIPAWEVELTGLFCGDERQPFWLYSGREGKILPDGNTASMALRFKQEPLPGRRLDVFYGVELYGRHGLSNDLWLQQGYAGMVFYDLVRVQAGWWNDITASRVPEISSGSIIWSGNARPLPRIEAGTPGYITVPRTSGRLEIKGQIAHGWFGEDRYVSDVLLHHKNAFARLGGDFPVNYTYGLNHYALWGGHSPDYDEPFPADPDSYYRVFFIRSGKEDDPATPGTWANHKFGDHLGSRFHGIDLTLETLSAGIFLQDVMEDGSGWRRQNFPDGLWAVWLEFHERKQPLQAITYEYLQTTDQSGPRHNGEDGNVIGGNDNYFNHAIYQSGWSYHGYTIGTPLITSPLLNDPTFHRFTSNRVRAHHLGLKGHLGPRTRYRSLITYSRNYGTHNDPFDQRKDQVSGMLELTRQLDFLQLEAGITLAADRGAMYGDNYGVMLQLRYGWDPAE